MAADSMSATIHKYFEAYKKWVTSNPQIVGDIETTVKWLSYFTAGRVNSSALTSELVYSMSNLLVLFNDRLLYSNKCIELQLPPLQSKIKIWLTVLEYMEVLLEVSASKLWGETGKWLIILFLQAFKALMRLLLVHRYKERVTQNPPIAPLKREKLNDSCAEAAAKEGFSLKRSGKVIRTVNSAGPSQMRLWSPLPTVAAEEQQLPSNLPPRKNLLIAETLYIVKPLLHLGCLSMSGRKRWKPWFLSFIIDLASLKLFNQEAKITNFSKAEREEIFRRRIALLLYILRSPFYDKCSHTMIHALLQSISRNVPLARLVADPVAKYLPHWQNTYFYMWSC